MALKEYLEKRCSEQSWRWDEHEAPEDRTLK